MPMREILQTRVGPVTVQTEGETVQEVHLGARGRPRAASSPIARDLARYFSGEAVDFRGYDVDLSAYSEFERAVYAATRRIPAGELRTYGDIARAIGKPGASRAVGNALGKNPACIVIPCHRVVASDGLGGFTGGLGRKRKLLHLEGRL